MNTYNLFIGSSNRTGLVEQAKIEAVLSAYFDGYTIQASIGYWLGKKENSVVVTVVTDVNTLATVLNELKEVLHQDAIGWNEAGILQFA